MSKNKHNKFIKIAYFDESAAFDYTVLMNGGEYSEVEENQKEKVAKIIASLDAEASVGNSWLGFVRGLISGKGTLSYDSNSANIFASNLKSNLLADYEAAANNDDAVKKFPRKTVYAPENSITFYRMISTFLNIVPQEDMPAGINFKELDHALLNERGYYQMLLTDEKEDPDVVLRFNIDAFKNNYSLADLTKMKLTYYGVAVGNTTLEELKIENEFNFASVDKKSSPSPMNVVDGDNNKDEEEKKLTVYDIILAGVVHENN